MQLHQDMANKGVVLIGLSYESADLVGPHLKKEKTPYLIGAESQPTNDDFGVKGYPTVLILDTSGRVTWTGNPLMPDSDFKDALDATMKKSPPKPGLPFAAAEAAAQLKKADRLFKQEKYALALKAYEAIVADSKDTQAGKTAAKQVAKIKADEGIMRGIHDAEAKKQCTSWLNMARSLSKAGKPDAARKYYRKVIDTYGDTSYAETAKREMAEL